MANQDNAAAQLYQERSKRIQDAIDLKEPDRVPIIVNFGYFGAKYYGITIKEAMYDAVKMDAAWEKTITDFKPDAYENPFTTRHGGSILEIINYKMMKWPGHGVDDNHSFQYLDFENLKADEYDEFLFDPTDFILRKFWPRVFGSLESFSELPRFRSIIGHMGFNRFAALDIPEIDAAIEALNRARKQSVKDTSAISAYVQKMEGLGFPPIFGGAATVPFDLISDQFRGTRGAMIDMYRQPDKLQAAMDKVLPMMLEGAIAAARKNGCQRVFIPLHKGQEYFMSEDQYKKFYWPGYRALMMGLIDAGLTPCSLVEGEYTSRLKIISDIPKGKVLYHFERVDMLKAKEILGDIACIRGGVPITMMCTNTPQQIREHCKWLIENIGKGGGFIMDAGVALDDAPVENVRALFEATREYGAY